MSFVEWRSFKTNKRVILFCRKLVSRSKNLNQRKSRSMNLLFLTIYYFNPIFKFQIRLFFTVKKEITNFLFPIYYLNPILSCWLINLGVFQIGKKTITNFLNPLNIYKLASKHALTCILKDYSIFWVKINNLNLL